MHANAGTVLLHTLKIPAEAVVRRIDGLAQQPLQSVPRRENLLQVLFGDHVPGAVESNALLNLDPKVASAGTAFLQGFQKLRMRYYTGTAANKIEP